MRSKEKQAAYMKIYRAANKEKAVAYAKAYCVANREKIAAKKKVYQAENREQRTAYDKIYRAANREKHLAYFKNYREANPEKIAAYRKANREELLAYQNEYAAAHPNERLALKHKQRAKKAGVKIGDTKVIIAWIKGWKTEATVACHYCKAVSPGTDMTIDHVIPLSAGGPHDLQNLVVCCSFCNKSKHNRLPTEWLARTG